MANRGAAAKLNTGTDKRYVRRGKSDDVGRATVQDRRRNAQRKAKRGRGIRVIADCHLPDRWHQRAAKSLSTTTYADGAIGSRAQRDPIRSDS